MKEEVLGLVCTQFPPREKRPISIAHDVQACLRVEEVRYFLCAPVCSENGSRARVRNVSAQGLPELFSCALAPSAADAEVARMASEFLLELVLGEAHGSVQCGPERLRALCGKCYRSTIAAPRASPCSLAR